MLKLYWLRCSVFALTVYAGHVANSQESTLNTLPMATLPTVSSERLGTGVPSRLPKVEAQRPVFTIQSGGPIAVPKPTFRPIRETNAIKAPALDAKSNLPMIEQTRPWQKPGIENSLPMDRQLQAITQIRPAALPIEPKRIHPVTPTTLQPLPRLAAESLNYEHHYVTGMGPAPQLPLPRYKAVPAPISENPARVLNFSIK